MARPREAAFRFADRWLRLALKGIAACHQGLWLGLLDAAALDRITERQYEAWRKYRSAEHNRSGLMAWEAMAIDRHFAGRRSLLVAAAGGGREMLALARRGHQVTGFDCSRPLVESCRELLDEEGVAAEVLLAPPGSVPSAPGRFDGALVGWGAYMHVPGRARRVDLLRRLRRRLAPQAPLLLSFLTRPDVSRFHRWVRGLASGVRRLRRAAEPAELGDSLSGTFEHHFTREEVRSELEAGGFELAAFGEQPYGWAVGRARPLDQPGVGAETGEPPPSPRA